MLHAALVSAEYAERLKRKGKGVLPIGVYYLFNAMEEE